MNESLACLITIYIISGLILIFYSYNTIFKKKKQRIEDNLKIIRESSDPHKISQAIIQLIELSYIEIHILVEENKEEYDEILQSEKFNEALTLDVINRLKEIDNDEIKNLF